MVAMTDEPLAGHLAEGYERVAARKDRGRSGGASIGAQQQRDARDFVTSRDVVDAGRDSDVKAVRNISEWDVDTDEAGA